MGQKILVVEDNELNLKLFCDLLRAHGYEAEPVRDGRQAVERAREFGPDLIVMDIQMPHISGLELIEQLKSDGELRSVPVMAVTAYAAKGDEERIRDAGAEGYVSKPISVMKFVEAVRALLAVEREAEVSLTTQLRVTRLFQVSAETLFDAWLDPAKVGKWLFATPSGEMVRTEVDGQVGGAYTIVERRGGEDVLHTGHYEQVERPRRLVFTLQVPAYSDDMSRVIVDIEEDGDGSQLVLTQESGPASDEDKAKYEQGWSTVLAALAAELERAKASKAEP